MNKYINKLKIRQWCAKVAADNSGYIQQSTFYVVKEARWKKPYGLNIQQIWNFPPNHWESGFCVGFCKENSWVPHCKTLAQLTHSYLETEKKSS